MNANRTPLKQSITEKVVAPIDRARFHPDTGVAYFSKHYYRGSVGTSSSAEKNFFEDIYDRFANELSSIFHIGGLQSDDIYLDVLVRTPNGNQILPNVRLAKNAYAYKGDDDLRRLKAGEKIYVKITYDGGRPTEVTPTSWVFDSPSAAAIQSEQTVLDASGQTAPAAGSIGSLSPNGGPADPLTSLEPTGSSFLQFICDEPALKQWAGYINYAASLFKIDANLIAGVVITESGGRSNARSQTGACGLMQIEPDTFPDTIAAVKAKYPHQALSSNSFDPLTNVLCGTAYIAALIKQFSGDVNKGIAAYNAGAGTVQQFNKKGYALPFGIGILGNGQNFIETGGTDPVNDPRGYVYKVTHAWAAYSKRSSQLGDTKINQRPEVARTEQTNATGMSAHLVGGGGAVAS